MKFYSGAYNLGYRELLLHKNSKTINGDLFIKAILNNYMQIIAKCYTHLCMMKLLYINKLLVIGKMFIEVGNFKIMTPKCFVGLRSVFAEVFRMALHCLHCSYLNYGTDIVL